MKSIWHSLIYEFGWLLVSIGLRSAGAGILGRFGVIIPEHPEYWSF
jgi:hypothetical protein